MHLAPSQHADVTVVAPSGRIDHRTANDFEAALAPHLDRCREGGDKLVLDLGAVDYMSSVGLRVLMLAAKTCRAQRGAMAVAALQPTLAEIFRISRFDKIFDVHDTVASALAALSPQAARAARDGG